LQTLRNVLFTIVFIFAIKVKTSVQKVCKRNFES